MANERFGYYPYTPIPVPRRPSQSETDEDAIREIVKEITAPLKGNLADHAIKNMIGHMGHGIAEPDNIPEKKQVNVHQRPDGTLYVPESEVNPDTVRVIVNELVDPMIGELTEHLEEILNLHKTKMADASESGHVKANDGSQIPTENRKNVYIGQDGRLFVENQEIAVNSGHIYLEPSGDTSGEQDYANINNAIRALRPNGGMIHLGLGDFYCNQTLELYDKVVFQGVSGGSEEEAPTRLHYVGDTFHPATVLACVGCGFRDLSLIGKVTDPLDLMNGFLTPTALMLQVANTSYDIFDQGCGIVYGTGQTGTENEINGYVIVENVTISNFQGWGLKVKRNARGAVFEHITMRTCGGGLALAYGSADNKFFDIRIGHSNVGLGTGYTYRNTFDNLHITQTGAYRDEEFSSLTTGSYGMFLEYMERSMISNLNLTRCHNSTIVMTKCRRNKIDGVISREGIEPTAQEIIDLGAVKAKNALYDTFDFTIVGYSKGYEFSTDESLGIAGRNCIIGTSSNVDWHYSTHEFYANDNTNGLVKE